MMIVGIDGSANGNGSTRFLLDEVLTAAESSGARTVVLHAGTLLAEAGNPFCNVCSVPCTGACFRGTRLSEGFDLMRAADGVVLASPVHFGTVSAQLKAFFDKTRFLRNDRALYGKIGAGVTVGAARFGGQETTLRALHDMMLIHGMTLVGDGVSDVDCGHHGVCGQRPASSDEFAIQHARMMGKRVYEACAERAIRPAAVC